MAPLLRKPSQVFVDIPPSPLHRPQAKAPSSSHIAAKKTTSKSLGAPPKIQHRLSIVEVEIPYSPLRTRSNSTISKADRPPSLQSGLVGTSQKRKIKTPSGDQNSHVGSTSHVERPSKKKRVEVPPVPADLTDIQVSANKQPDAQYLLCAWLTRNRPTSPFQNLSPRSSSQRKDYHRPKLNGSRFLTRVRRNTWKIVLWCVYFIRP